MSFLHEAAIYLAAAVVCVPLFQRLGLGSILGYLTAGAIIGPSGVKLIGNVDDVLHFSELGVVFFLFLVGLELQPSRLWALRRSVFGLGAAQVVVTSAAFALVAFLFGLPPAAAVITGLGLSLSSTAIVLQLIGERGEIATPHGRGSFAILLFQDLAVVPLLALVPLLSTDSSARGSAFDLLSLVKIVAVLVGLVLASRLLLRPAFRLVAASKSQEIFTAAALLVVMGTALLVSVVGLSMALGAFLAGVLLADSEYRHELEADIAPFKGLLLGLFFIAVGMSANLGLLVERPLVVVGAVVGLFVVKLTIVYGLGRAAKLEAKSARSMAVALAQGGEFAFVLFGVAAGAGVLDEPLADLLVVVVSVSMALTPLAIPLMERFVEPLLAKQTEAREFDAIDEHDNHVVIAGFGRYGQIVARVLQMAGVPYTALEKSSDQVDFVRKWGNKIYYGDAARLDLLRAAKTEDAKAFVLAIDEPDASLHTAEMVTRQFPDVPVFARARNRQHYYKLMDLGIDRLNRETYSSSLETAAAVLERVGFSKERAAHVVARFRAYDEELITSTHAIHKDEAKLIQAAKKVPEELRALFEQDALTWREKGAELVGDGPAPDNAGDEAMKEPPAAEKAPEKVS